MADLCKSFKAIRDKEWKLNFRPNPDSLSAYQGDADKTVVITMNNIRL
jgi:hypothetical protein